MKLRSAFSALFVWERVKREGERGKSEEGRGKRRARLEMTFVLETVRL
jgi:hypothetical protein